MVALIRHQAADAHPVKALRQIIRELLSFEPEHTGTDINSALQYLTNVQKRRCTAFLISDLMDPKLVESRKTQDRSAQRQVEPIVIASRKHDLSAIQIYDCRDAEMPNIGLLKVRDPETGTRIWTDTSLASVRKAYGEAWRKQQEALENLFTKTGMNHVSMRTDEDYVKKLMMLFHN